MKTFIIAALTLIIGFGIGMMGNTRVVEKTVETIETVERDEWYQLKEIDDEGFILAQKIMNLCSDGFTAMSELDVDRLKGVTTEMQTIPKKVNEVAEKRNKILKKLGY